MSSVNPVSAVSGPAGFLGLKAHRPHGMERVRNRNRQPNLPKRSGRNHPDAMAEQITAWRQGNPHQADAPCHIHQDDSEQAWEANRRE